MTDETGELQFQAHRTSKRFSTDHQLDELLKWRQICYENDLIGVYENGIGYGNVSCLNRENDFILITGTGTGKRTSLSETDIAQVQDWSYGENRVRYRGNVKPSSETLTHAAVYDACPSAGGVIHGHDEELWQELVKRNSVTKQGAPAGTVEISEEVKNWIQNGRVRDSGLFALSGHRDGIISYGPNLKTAGDLLISRSADQVS